MAFIYKLCGDATPTRASLKIAPGRGGNCQQQQHQQVVATCCSFSAPRSVAKVSAFKRFVGIFYAFAYYFLTMLAVQSLY